MYAKSPQYNSLQPRAPLSTRLLCPWDSLGKNTGVSCHAFLWRIFPTQGSNPRLLCLLNWQARSLPLAAAVPNLFGTRDWFHGRPLFHKAWSVCGYFGMIQVHYMYCTLYFHYYYISSTSGHQTLDTRGWGTLFWGTVVSAVCGPRGQSWGEHSTPASFLSL